MKIQFFKTHPDAQLPKRNHDDHMGISGTHDSGYDIFAAEDTNIFPSGPNVVPTGIKVAYITPGYWFRIESRSGLSFKHGILAHPGIIDNQYRGDLGVCVYNHGSIPYTVKKGDKIAQLVVYKVIDSEVEWSEEIDETKRGEKGFGSSGS